MEVAVADTYSIEGFVATGPSRGIAQLLVDGKRVGEPVDLYSPHLRIWPGPSRWMPEETGALTTLGKATLTAGSHAFRLQLVGKNSASTGFDVGLRGLLLKAISDVPFVQDWMVIGPFPTAEYRELRRSFPPEKEIDFNKAYKGLDGTDVRWQPAQAETDGWLDLSKAFGIPSGLGYALAYVESPKDQLANLRLGTGGTIRVWVNGSLAWKHEACHRDIPDLDQVVVPLRAGMNAVLVKIRDRGSWRVCLRLSGGSEELTYGKP